MISKRTNKQQSALFIIDIYENILFKKYIIKYCNKIKIRLLICITKTYLQNTICEVTQFIAIRILFIQTVFSTYLLFCLNINTNIRVKMYENTICVYL